MASIRTGSYWTSLGAVLVKTVRAYLRESLIAFAMSIALSIAIADPMNGVQQDAIRTGMGLTLGIAISIGSTVLYRSGRINAITDWAFATLAVAATTWHAQFLNFDNADGIVEFVYLLVLAHVFAASAWSVRIDANTFWNHPSKNLLRPMPPRMLDGLIRASMLDFPSPLSRCDG
ncbi:MAG: hypothetical protein FJ211_05485 [Ignavibacteria bacterium]|nr:hypothetical protein [Ignavibacteria bacterium]